MLSRVRSPCRDGFVSLACFLSGRRRKQGKAAHAPYLEDSSSRRLLVERYKVPIAEIAI
jgi:hypothetical protein